MIERLENELVAQTAALDDLLNPRTGRQGRAKQAELPPPDSQLMTYKPVISKRAHELPSRSFEELSEGDRLRHACYVVSPAPALQTTPFTSIGFLMCSNQLLMCIL